MQQYRYPFQNSAPVSEACEGQPLREVKRSHTLKLYQDTYTCIALNV